MNGREFHTCYAHLLRDAMIEEAEASVLLDLDSGVHTCYAGHDCAAEREERLAEAERIRARRRAE